MKSVIELILSNFPFENGKIILQQEKKELEQQQQQQQQQKLIQIQRQYKADKSIIRIPLDGEEETNSHPKLRGLKEAEEAEEEKPIKRRRN